MFAGGFLEDVRYWLGWRLWEREEGEARRGLENQENWRDKVVRQTPYFSVFGTVRHTLFVY